MRLRIIGIPAGQRRVVERVAFGLLGLAVLLSVAGMVLKGIKRRSPPHFITVLRSGSPSRLEVPTPAANPARQPAGVPEADVHLSVVVTKDVMPETPPTPASKHTAKPSPKAGERENGFQLRSGGPLAVLAYAEAAAVELRKDPGRLAELVQGGLLFGVPNDTAVTIEERHDGLLKVRILDTAMQGKVGWVRVDQVIAR
jgi:hypothetical protein